MSNSLQPHESQHARPPCPSPTPGVHSDSRPSSQWCHRAISSPVVPFSSCPQSLPASKSFPVSQLFTWEIQVIHLLQEYHKINAMFLLHPVTGRMTLICSIKVHVNFENLNKVVSASLLHHKLPFFFSLSISVNWRASLRVWKYSIPPHTFILFPDLFITIFSWGTVTHLFIPTSLCTHSCVSFSGLLFFFSDYNQMWPGKSLQDDVCFFACIFF